MQTAPDLTEDEREKALARCPEEQLWAFRGWLDGTHDLDGTPREEVRL